MPSVKQLMHEGIRHQITRVLEAMGDQRIEKGLTAFKDGASTWTACFFARAYPEINLLDRDPEARIAELLGMPGNKVPMRIVYRTFDGLGIGMTKRGMEDFIVKFLAQNQEDEAELDAAIAGVNYTGAEDRPIDFNECATVNHAPEWAQTRPFQAEA